MRDRGAPAATRNSYTAVGRRKRSVARVMLTPGQGNIIVNGEPFDKRFPRGLHQAAITLPLRLTNRLTSLLKQYFPQALEWVGDLASVQAVDFLTQWPTLAAVQRARSTTIRQFYRAHNCRKADVIEGRLAAIAAARPLTTDAAVIEPLSLSVQTYAAHLVEIMLLGVVSLRANTKIYYDGANMRVTNNVAAPPSTSMK